MIRRIYKSIPIVVLLLSHLTFGFIPQSQDSTQTDQKIYDGRVQLTFGLFLPSINSTAQINTQTGNLGTIINLETVFKLPETQQLFRFNGVYRFNNKHSAEAYYYALNRSGSSVTADSLVFGDLIINVNSSVSSYFNATLFGGKYRYSIHNGEDVEAGLSVGLSFLDLSVGAEAVLFNQPLGEESYNDLLFLPVFGFYNRINIVDNLIFRSNVDAFALNIKKYDGILFDFGVSLEYLFLQRFSIGLSYNVFSLDIKFDSKENGRITYGHKGFMFFGKIYF
jgi:hypothetical protein